MRLAGFIKVRNETIREGNLYRVLVQMEQICDCGVICDDASTDGTREILEAWVAEQDPWYWTLLRVPREEQAFRHEMKWKQVMLDDLHSRMDLRPDWILWQDGDELFSDLDLAGFRAWLEKHESEADVWAFHYTQPWRTLHWARTDDGFDQGWFWQLWRYSPDLHFELADQLHSYQFPKNFLPKIMDAVNHGGSHGRARRAPQDILHVGNVGKNLVWKCIQYRNSGPLQDASMKRHLYFDTRATYRAVEAAGSVGTRIPQIANDLPRRMDPNVPFTEREQKLIEQMGDLRKREGLCVVIIPTFNRGASGYLERAVESVKSQTYENWVCVVLDDGSTDNTAEVMRRLQDSDPRVFYCLYQENRGGVAMNEIGMDLACEFGEFWQRLGSDDYFKPSKLELDVKAFRAMPNAGACWGPYRDLHGETDERECRGIPTGPNADARGSLLSHGFAASWANIAIRTSILKQVRERYGHFVDPKIRNMEDYLLNVRVAWLTEFAWRGRLKDGRIIVATILQESARLVQALVVDFENNLEYDAVWHIGADGASQKGDQCAKDATVTMEIIRSMTDKPAPRESPVVVELP